MLGGYKLKRDLKKKICNLLYSVSVVETEKVLPPASTVAVTEPPKRRTNPAYELAKSEAKDECCKSKQEGNSDRTSCGQDSHDQVHIHRLKYIMAQDSISFTFPNVGDYVAQDRLVIHRKTQGDL